VSPKLDLAVLTIPMNSNMAITRLDCRLPYLDQSLLSVSHPAFFRWFVAHGYMASDYKDMRGVSKSNIVLNIAIYPGSSGVPVFDNSGRVRGIILATLGTRIYHPGTGISSRVMIPGFTLGLSSRAICKEVRSVKKLSKYHL